MDDIEKTIWHLFYTTPSLVHHFKAIGEFKLELPPGNAQLESKLTMFCPAWPWKTIVLFVYATSSFVHHFKTISEFHWELPSRKVQSESKSAIFLSRVTAKFDGWPWRQTGLLFYTTSNFVHCFKATSELKLEVHHETLNFGKKTAIFLSYMALKFGGCPWKTGTSYMLL